MIINSAAYLIFLDLSQDFRDFLFILWLDSWRLCKVNLRNLVRGHLSPPSGCATQIHTQCLVDNSMMNGNTASLPMNNIGVSYSNGFILPPNYGQVPVFHSNYSLQNLVSSNTPIPSNLPLNSVYSGGLNNANYFSNPMGFPPNSTCTFTTTTSTANISDLKVLRALNRW